MNVETCTSAAEVAIRCADRVAHAVKAKADAVILLPAGATPRPLYAELVRRCRANELDLSQAHLFQLDELLGVGAEDARSFHHFLRDSLLSHVRRSEGRDHLLSGTATDPDNEIARHANELAALGGADLVLLGIGGNGHVAFNEPGTQLDQAARKVQLDATTVAALAPAFQGETVPSEGITLGLREIAAGRELCILATGASKATVLQALLDDEASPALPASLLRGHAGLSVYADEAAMSQSARS